MAVNDTDRLSIVLHILSESSLNSAELSSWLRVLLTILLSPRSLSIM